MTCFPEFHHKERERETEKGEGEDWGRRELGWDKEWVLYLPLTNLTFLYIKKQSPHSLSLSLRRGWEGIVALCAVLTFPL